MDLQEEAQEAIAALNDANSSEYVGDCEALGRAEAVLKKIVALNVLQGRTCGACEYWLPPQRIDDRAGSCNRIEDSDFAKEGDLAYVTAAYDEVKLCTRANFSCALWTVKRP